MHTIYLIRLGTKNVKSLLAEAVTLQIQLLGAVIEHGLKSTATEGQDTAGIISIKC